MLHIIKNDYFLINYIVDRLQGHQGVNIITFKRSETRLSLWKKLIRFYDLKMGNAPRSLYLQSEMLDQFKSIGASDEVLFFGVENQKDLTLMSRLLSSQKKSVWIWNPLFTITKGVWGVGDYAKSLAKLGYNLYTFDHIDGEKQGFKVLPQVYAHPQNYPSTDATTASDLFFIGADKNRIDKLIFWTDKFNTLNLKSKILLLKDKRKNYDKYLNRVGLEFIDSPIDYTQTLELMSNSVAILDLVQSNQYGSTLRPLEALFLNKKVVTDNISVKSETYYNPNFIFILGVDPLENLNSFLSNKSEKMDMSILEKYEVENWIKYFLN